MTETKSVLELLKIRRHNGLMVSVLDSASSLSITLKFQVPNGYWRIFNAGDSPATHPEDGE